MSSDWIHKIQHRANTEGVAKVSRRLYNTNMKIMLLSTNQPNPQKHPILNRKQRNALRREQKRIEKEKRRNFRYEHNITTPENHVRLNNRYLNKYGISLFEVQQRLVEQHHKCAICLTPFNDKIQMCVDHKHGTVVVRGILCGFCNRGLGLFRDNPTYLANAIKYLDIYE